LQELVRVAHENGIYVILDIILNHAGNIFSYSGDRFFRRKAAIAITKQEVKFH